nr:PREDICTED: uncharacterized protein LOC109030870 [Bemisia tabaci]
MSIPDRLLGPDIVHDVILHTHYLAHLFIVDIRSLLEIPTALFQKSISVALKMSALLFFCCQNSLPTYLIITQRQPSWECPNRTRSSPKNALLEDCFASRRSN